MKEKIDLHEHTHYSDGELSPSDVVLRAKKMGYTKIAITDHDGVGGIREAVEAAQHLGGIRVVSGVELSAEEKWEEGKSLSLHILGYGFDAEDPALTAELARMKVWREERNRKLFAVLAKMGYELSLSEMMNNKGGYVGKPDIARALAAKGYVRSPKEAFAPGHFLGAPEVKAVYKEKLPANRAVRLIVDAGGWSVLAHPMKIKRLGQRGSADFWTNLEELIGRLMEYGLSGLECRYPEHTNQEEAALVRLAVQFGLRMTEGSDFHGDSLR